MVYSSVHINGELPESSIIADSSERRLAIHFDQIRGERGLIEWSVGRRTGITLISAGGTRGDI